MMRTKDQEDANWSRPYYPYIGEPGERFIKLDLNDIGPNSFIKFSARALEEIEDGLEASKSRLTAEEYAGLMEYFEEVKNPPVVDGLHWPDGGKFLRETRSEEDQEQDYDEAIAMEEEEAKAVLLLPRAEPYSMLFSSANDRKYSRAEVDRANYNRVNLNDFVVFKDAAKDTADDLGYGIGRVKLIDTLNYNVQVEVWSLMKNRSTMWQPDGSDVVVRLTADSIVHHFANLNDHAKIPTSHRKCIKDKLKSGEHDNDPTIYTVDDRPILDVIDDAEEPLSVVIAACSRIIRDIHEDVGDDGDDDDDADDDDADGDDDGDRKEVVVVEFSEGNWVAVRVKKNPFYYVGMVTDRDDINTFSVKWFNKQTNGCYKPWRGADDSSTHPNTDVIYAWNKKWMSPNMRLKAKQNRELEAALSELGISP
jgi:hypothetical protein